MDAKRYLQRLKYLKQRIKRTDEEIESLYARFISSRNGYMQRLTKLDYSDKIGDLLTMIEERINTLKALNREYCDMRTEIENTLTEFSAYNGNYAAILAMKYIDEKPFSLIADSLFLTHETVLTYHGIALKILADILDGREHKGNQAAELLPER